jgi:Flp pilus assembly protein TadG
LTDKKNSRGQALIELAFMAPLIVFLIVAVADLGVFLVAAIGVQNSVRAAALYASSSTATAAGACEAVTQELQSLPNYSDFSDGTCSSPTLQVAIQQINAGLDGNPATLVTVTYQTIPLLPIPFLPGQITLVRSAEMPATP